MGGHVFCFGMGETLAKPSQSKDAAHALTYVPIGPRVGGRPQHQGRLDSSLARRARLPVHPTGRPYPVECFLPPPRFPLPTDLCIRAVSARHIERLDQFRGANSRIGGHETSNRRRFVASFIISGYRYGMDAAVRAYLSAIGRRGGQRSRRHLSSETARNMVRLREARRAFRHFHAQCFWSSDPGYQVVGGDIAWVAERLMTFGGREGWTVGARLCR